jgi:ribonuclease HI
VHNKKRKPLWRGSLGISHFNADGFFTKPCTTCGGLQILESEPKNRLDAETFPAHLDRSANENTMPELVAHVDGGSLGNPGPSGIGVIINGCESGTIRIAKWIGRQDNNVAEYVALMEALQCAVSLKARTLHVYSDSEVVVRQMNGRYRCRSPRLYSLHWTCCKLARALKFSISHVRREDNAEANRLANAAVRAQRRAVATLQARR